MSWSRMPFGACCLGLLLTGPGLAQTMFTKVTEEALPSLPSAFRSAVADVNNDGWPDLWAIGFDEANRLYLVLNQGNGRFVQHSSIFEDDTVGHSRAGGIFGDYDNDGDLDLFIPVGAWIEGEEGSDVLLRNDRGVLREVTPGTGLEAERVNTDNAIWLDYDRDGHLDLYLGHFWTSGDGKRGDPSLRNRLYRNQGDNTFADLTQQAGLDIQLDPVHGGSGQGMVAGDFDDDGWPDLYVPVFQGDNQLFLNNRQGGFTDATTREIADEGGEAFGVAVGDIDNDGDLDIFQPSGAGVTKLQRSLMLLNLGKGQFLDVTEGVGLGGLGHSTQGQTRGGALADLDNDGDLDLVIAHPLYLFLNDGQGFFTEATSRLGETGTPPNAYVVVGDLDLDGFLDIWADGNRTDKSSLLHNLGNDNHFLSVELVGVKSNRSGIGARLFATSGNLKQMREILGGMGLTQDEMVAHFGLGQHTQVGRLEIRWPSGQVDVLTDIPADQKIRVFEGRTTYQVTRPTIAEISDTLVVGSEGAFTATIRPALFEPGAQITSVTADLSELGGPEAVPLQANGDGTYRLEPLSLPIAGPNGYRTLSVMIDQSTSLGPYWTRLSRQLVVAPSEDLVVFDEALAQDWQAEGNSRLKRLDLSEAGVVYQGRLAGAFEGGSAFSPWTVSFKSSVPVNPVGYTVLHFVFHPGELTLRDPTRFTATLVPGKAVSLLDSGWVDLNRKAWQVVEIPVDAFERLGPIESIAFSGNFAGTFYLDDLRLVAATPPPATVVEEDRTTALPQSFSLSQNFPNPFNGDTVIRFALPESAEVELAVYNLAGQRVAVLAEGVREAGSYTVRWDGRDDQGRELASGVYLYRLRAGAQEVTRRLALVR